MMSLSAFGLRDAMLLLVVLAAIYLMIMLLKLIQVGRKRTAVQEEAPPAGEDKVETVSFLRRRAEPELAQPERAVAATQAAAAYAEEYAAVEARAGAAVEERSVPAAASFEWDDVRDLFGEESAGQGREAPPARRPGFGEHLADHLARSDMEMEVQRMRDEMERMRAEVEELRAARRVSPQYAEAMELVQRGLSAQEVADRLGISLAEAELVQALGRGEGNFDEGEDHGADGYATNDGFDEFGQRRPG
ncbi:MAG: DUF2802 domain-containing protein [Pseudomonadota bacterium]